MHASELVRDSGIGGARAQPSGKVARARGSIELRIHGRMTGRHERIRRGGALYPLDQAKRCQQPPFVAEHAHVLERERQVIRVFPRGMENELAEFVFEANTAEDVSAQQDLVGGLIRTDGRNRSVRFPVSALEEEVASG